MRMSWTIHPDALSCASSGGHPPPFVRDGFYEGQAASAFLEFACVPYHGNPGRLIPDLNDNSRAIPEQAYPYDFYPGIAVVRM
jgi:hypothetical protein